MDRNSLGGVLSCFRVIVELSVGNSKGYDSAILFPGNLKASLHLVVCSRFRAAKDARVETSPLVLIDVDLLSVGE